MTIRQLVVHSMSDWYVKADKLGDQVEQQTRLSRILDVAQDLKVLMSYYAVITYLYIYKSLKQLCNSQNLFFVRKLQKVLFLKITY